MKSNRLHLLLKLAIYLNINWNFRFIRFLSLSKHFYFALMYFLNLNPSTFRNVYNNKSDLVE